jgi:hypothetical protein
MIERMTISRLLGFLRNPAPKSSVADFEAALREASRELVEARDLLTRTQADYAEARLDADPKTTRGAKDKIIAAEVLLDRAESVVELATQRLAEAREADAEAERKRAFATAKRLSKSAAESLRSYGEHAAAIKHIIHQIALADQAIAAANADLPAGADRLPFPEQVARGLPGEPAETISVEYGKPHWRYVDHTIGEGVVEPSFIAKIEKTAPGRGTLELRRDGVTRRVDVILRREKRTTIREHRGSFVPISLARTVELPGFAPGEPPIFKPVLGPGLGAPGEDTSDALKAIRVGEEARGRTRDPRPERQDRVHVEVVDAVEEPTEVQA